MDIVSIAAELCSNQVFAGKISLFQSNWKALTSDSWVLETVIKEYHIPLISNPVQQTSLHCPRLPHKDQIRSSGGQDQIILAEIGDSTPPYPTTWVLFRHVHGIRTSVSRVDCIRDICQSGRLSETATDLMLSSCRDKSTKSYNSSFNKWARWCKGQDRNPFLDL